MSSPASSARDARSAEAGLKYFVLGALACGILLYGISLLYGFTGTTLFGGIAAALGDGVSTGELFGIVFVLAGLAFKVSAVPFHMWTPDVYEGAPTPVTAFFASAPKVAAMALLIRVAVEAMGPATDALAADRDLRGSGLDRPRRRRRDRPDATSSGCSPTARSTMSASPWSASPPRASPGVASVLFYMAVYVVMTLGAFLVVLQDARRRRPAGRDASPASPACRAPGRWLALGHGDLHVQPRRHPASVRLLAQVPGVRRGGRGGPHLARRGRDRDLGDRRLLLHHDRQADVFRRARARPSPRRGSRSAPA